MVQPGNEGITIMKIKRRIKLNMLRPGTIICEICLLLLLVSILTYCLKFYMICKLAAGIAAILFIILIILIKIESYQDEKDYQKWKASKEEDEFH